MAVSEQIRSDVWVAMLDVGRQSRYYGKQFEKYSKRQSVIESVLLVSGSAGLVSLATQWTSWIPAICIAAASLAALIGRTGQYSKKAACLYFIRCDCESLEQKWELLWSRMESGLVADEEALEKNQRLLDALRIVTDKASLAGLPIDHAANQIAWEEAIQVKQGQYAENNRDQGILATT